MLLSGIFKIIIDIKKQDTRLISKKVFFTDICYCDLQDQHLNHRDNDEC